jgi:hypothetical protein
MLNVKFANMKLKLKYEMLEIKVTWKKKITCSLRTSKLNKSCGQSLMRPCWSKCFQNRISKDSWLITHKPIGTLLKLFMVMGTLLLGWLIKNALVYSIGFNRSIGTQKIWLNLSCKINTTFYATNTRMQNLCGG